MISLDDVYLSQDEIKEDGDPCRFDRQGNLITPDEFEDDDFDPESVAFTFYVRSANYKPYIMAQARALERSDKNRKGRKLRGAEKAVQLNEESNPKLLAKHLVTGWDDVAIGGKEIEFSVSHCETFLKRYPKLRNGVTLFANTDEYHKNSETVKVMGKLKAVQDS